MQAKSSNDMLAACEDDLFDIFKRVANTATHTAKGQDIVDNLHDVGVTLSLDVEQANEYFRSGNPYVSKAIHME